MKLYVALAALVLAVAPASAVTVNFDSLSAGNNANPLMLQGATFQTLGGFNYIVDYGGSNTLCTSAATNNPGDCARNLEVTFAGPVSNISFGFGANNVLDVGGSVGSVNIFSGASLLGTQNMLVQDTKGFTLDTVTLAGFANVTRLAITSTDLGGLVYDNFSFSSSSVPEPATWAMMVGGFGLVGAGMRRRQRANARLA